MRREDEFHYLSPVAWVPARIARARLQSIFKRARINRSRRPEGSEIARADGFAFLDFSTAAEPSNFEVTSVIENGLARITCTGGFIRAPGPIFVPAPPEMQARPDEEGHVRLTVPIIAHATDLVEGEARLPTYYTIYTEEIEIAFYSGALAATSDPDPPPDGVTTNYFFQLAALQNGSVVIGSGQSLSFHPEAN